ncbi:MAG: histidinol-phosphate transaminase [Clostridiales bacterium]|uniref:histidinol-phosphate transaminase n=1 Tax=Terrisporobacter sp. TaxID=1965305 RepID=UPI002A5405DB|nr:histidinol-phosphate transaminase [Terrisporobacter sp.]MDD7756427.1 histidinol-phosphate transaminase [Clostridiales bacterium]MDY4136662.1 histidinol-phosphate transaminase [Terrisporobacter sp.]
MKEKQSVKELQPYVVNPVVCSVKLDANEGNKDLFKDLIKDIGDDFYLNLYPDDNYTQLKEAIVNYIGCKIENISVGNGSSELLDLCVKTFVDTNELILSLDPTFSMYSIYAKIVNSRYIGAGEGNDFIINVDDVIKSIKENDPKLTIICNPNNPTGTIIKRDDVLRIVKSTDNVVIVDEAYMEFSNESVVDEIENYDNLIVVKTMSKAFSMAGIRTGYLIANEELVKTIEKVRPPYNLNSISALLATKALKQKDKMLSYVENLKVEREKIYEKLLDMGVKAYKSGANFVFFSSKVDNLAEKLIDNDVLIRKFGGKLDNYYRVTVGSPKENEAFLNAMKKIV